MHPNLMSASAPRNSSNDAEPITGRCRSSEPPFNKKFRLGWCARRVNHLFEPDSRVLLFALAIQRSVNELMFPFRPTPNNREILFTQLLSLHQQAEVACGGGGFGS